MQKITICCLVMILILGMAYSIVNGQEISERVRDEKLPEQAFDNLDLLWGLGLQHSETYANAHNLWEYVTRQFPMLMFFPVSMPYDYKDSCVKFESGQSQLILVDDCGEHSSAPEALLEQSYEISQQLLSRYYLGSFRQKARTIYDELLEVARKEPDSALADNIPGIEEVLESVRKVEADPFFVNVVHIIETRNTLNDTEILLDLEEQIRQTLKNDVSFEPGKYTLEDFSEKGKEAIREFIARLLAIKEEYPLQYPEQPVFIKFKTVGFTDHVPVTSPNLIEELLQNVEESDVSQDEIARNEFLNRRLSEFRAGTVNEYARKQFIAEDKGNTEIHIESEIIGKGETLPSQEEVSPPYLRRDPRRRICKISVSFRREPLPFLTSKTGGVQ